MAKQLGARRGVHGITGTLNEPLGHDGKPMSLWRKSTVTEAETGVDIPYARACIKMSRPGQWDALKAAMQSGDDLYVFSTSQESWKHLGGRGGFALVRDGKVVESMVTVLN